MKNQNTKARLRNGLCGLSILAAMCATGCQVDIAGQVHPSPHYHSDDVQYFAPGSEFPLQVEASRMKAYNAQQQLQGR